MSSATSRSCRTSDGRDRSALSQASMVAVIRCALPVAPPSTWTVAGQPRLPPGDGGVVGRDAGGDREVGLAGLRAITRDPAGLEGGVGDGPGQRRPVARGGQVRGQVLPHVRLVRRELPPLVGLVQEGAVRAQELLVQQRADRRRAAAGTRGRGRGSRACRRPGVAGSPRPARRGRRGSGRESRCACAPSSVRPRRPGWRCPAGRPRGRTGPRAGRRAARDADPQGAERVRVGVGAVDVGVAGEIEVDLGPGAAALHRRGEKYHRQRHMADRGERAVGVVGQRVGRRARISAAMTRAAAGESTPDPMRRAPRST